MCQSDTGLWWDSERCELVTSEVVKDAGRVVSVSAWGTGKKVEEEVLAEEIKEIRVRVENVQPHALWEKKNK